MRTWVYAALAVTFAVVGVSAQEVEQPAVEDVGALLEQASYAIGFEMATNFHRRGIDLNTEMFVKGVQDAMSGAEPLLDQQGRSRVMLLLQQHLATEHARAQKELGGKNKAASEAFLAENAKREGVTVLPSGPQYEVIQEGTGQSPKATDVVTVHYRGTLIDGKEFDSSYERGEPATFQLNQVIPGWTEGLQLMKEGAKFKFFLPPSLAYGEQAVSEAIGPNSTLIFEVELLHIEPGDAEPED